MNYPLSLCYHPTKIILVDDNEKYLNEILFLLENKFFLNGYSNPLKVINFFKKLYKSSTFLERCNTELDEEMLENVDIDQLAYNVDLRLIRNEAIRPQRFQEIAVAIVDYAMPKMDGLKLSRQIKAIHPAINIILLTGEADEKLAIKAFNEGIIDHYVKKITPNIDEYLAQVIKQLEHKYFFSLSKIILSKLNASHKHELERLNEPAVIELFNQIERENNIVEYYLLDNNGNFLMVDKEGMPFWFVLLTDKEVNEFYEYAKPEKMSAEIKALRKKYPEQAEKKVPNSVLNALKNKEKVPFFFTDEDLTTPFWEWGPYLHPAKVLKTPHNTYYYALIKQPCNYQWPLEGFIGYQDYLANYTS